MKKAPKGAFFITVALDAYPLYPLLIGYRRSRPNARRETFGPGAA